MSALCKAIEQKRFRQAKLLLELGADVNRRDQNSGKTALVSACFLQNEALACQISRCLLNHGADVEKKDREGLTALMQACRLGKENLVRELLKTEECDLQTSDNKGNTALMHAVMGGNPGVVRILTARLNRYQLRAVDIPNDTGETPLIKAAKLGRTECTRVLLTDGKASANVRDLQCKLTAGEWQELMVSEHRNKESDPSVQQSSGPTKLNSLQIIREGNARKEGAWVTKGMNRISAENSDDLKKIIDLKQVEASPCGSKELTFVKEATRQNETKQTAGLKAAYERSTIINDDRASLRVHRHHSKVSLSVQSSVDRVHFKTKPNKAQGARTRGIGNLLNVLAHQNSPSFRPPVKPPPPEKLPETEAELRAKIIDLWYSDGRKPGRNSFSMPARSASQPGELSKATSAARTWRRFSSIYSQGDFTILRGERGGARHERRHSLATPDFRAKATAFQQTRRVSTGKQALSSLNTAKVSESYSERNVQRRREAQHASLMRRHSDVIPPPFVSKTTSHGTGSLGTTNTRNQQCLHDPGKLTLSCVTEDPELYN